MADVNARGALKLAALALILALATHAAAGHGGRAADPGAGTDIRVPAGSKLAFVSYAEGAQVYRWTGAAWAFVGPEAVLYDADGWVVGVHYAGPTWESESGSAVVGVVQKRYTPDPDAIPWLLLSAASSEGPGLFHRVTYIQRAYTAGGLAPGYPGEVAGEEVRVPYTAYYYFYREQR
jgi:hypothetical protein